MSDVEDSDKSNSTSGENLSLSRKKVKEHVNQLQRLRAKDPEFYAFLTEHDKDLLEFKDEDAKEDSEVVESQLTEDNVQKPSGKVITTAMVDSWCVSIKGNGDIGSVRSLLRAFRTACHYGDDLGTDSESRYSIVSSSVFNKIMVFVLNEMDGILRALLHAPSFGGKKETIMDLMTTNEWKKHGILMKLYLGNALYILTQMTDEQMISFTLKRVKASAVFLAAFPILLRKYIKVALHSWCTGRGVLPIVSFLLLRDLCVRLGSDCVDTCLKGMYKAYVMNCKLPKFASHPKLQHLQLLANCVTELYGLDLASSYQQAFVFIRQMAMVLQGALTKRGVKAGKDKAQGKQQERKNSTKQHNDKVYQKVYDWQFINCLELWTGVICAYCSEADFRPLAYPLTQIIYGVSCLVPTARYFPLRLRCIKMLNRIARATGNFIPVSSLLLDMFDMKELNRTATGGIGKAVNLQAVKQVDKSTLNTRAFQEACIYSIVEELAEHLAQWSYSVAFFELSFIPLVRLRSFCKTTKIDRLRRETRELIRKVEANCEFTNSQRVGITFTPNDLATESFLKADKEAGSSPLSKFAADLRLKAQQRDDSMVESSVIVGAKSSVFASKLPQSREDDSMDDDDDGAAVFSSSWLPEKKSKARTEKSKALKKQHHDDVGGDEDIVEDLVLSSDDDDDDDDLAGEVPDGSASKEEQHGSRRSKKKKPTTSQEKKKKHKRDAVSSKKRKRPGFKNKARKVAS